jgi:hypothetical protein
VSVLRRVSRPEPADARRNSLGDWQARHPSSSAPLTRAPWTVRQFGYVGPVARGYTTRKLEVWTLHAHVGNKPAGDYVAMFDAIAAVEPSLRQWETAEKVIALPKLEVDDGIVYLTAYEGPRGHPIIFDTESNAERREALQPGEIVATRTHALIDVQRREAIVEYNHRGAKANDIAVVLGAAGRHAPDWQALHVELSPKVDRSFVEGIDSFERIRVAGLRIIRPNFDWTKWHDTFSDTAADSDAQTAQAEFTARRGQSLSKTKGIVPFIKQRSEDMKATLKSAFVVGRREGENAESTLSLNDHKEQVRVNVRMTQNKDIDEADIRRHLAEYARARRENPDDQ